jgi:hypothetical protein
VNITQPIFREWKNQLPFIQPCYSVSDASSRAIISVMRENRIPMICANPRQVSFVDDHSLVIENNRFGTNEYIARNMKDLVASPHDRPPATSPRAPASPPLWIHTTISNDGIMQTREMFEYIWAHKYILKGIVFDIRNFSDKNSSVQPSMYSYKIAIDYLFRNIIHPFEKEYGIQTPAIMIDGQDHITQIRHLAELRYYALNETSFINGFTQKRPELRLILGALFDSVGGGGGGAGDVCTRRMRFAAHEYP